MSLKPYIVIKEFNYVFSTYSISEGDDLLTRSYTAEGHEVRVDEPKAVDGLGRAPNPIELFLTSLSSCFIVTLKLHARRYKLLIDRVEVFSEGSFDIRGFIMPDKFKSGFKDLRMEINLMSKARCMDITKLISRVLKGWVVGSTVSRGTPLKIKLMIKCIDEANEFREIVNELVLQE